MKKILPTFNSTITIFNKLSANDSNDKKDHWKSTILNNCFWSEKITSSNANTEINNATSFLIRIPYSENYKPYEIWKNTLNGFTISTGDIIVKGSINEDLSKVSSSYLLSKYEKAFSIKFIKDNTDDIQLLKHYHVEGA